MRRSLLLTASVLALTLAGGLLSACGTMGGQVLTNLQGCHRQYDGVVSAGLGAGFSGTVKIDCPPGQPADPEPTPPSPD